MGLGPSNEALQRVDCVHKTSSLRRASGNLLETDRDQFGLRALFYDGIPIVVDDFVPDTETLGTGTALSSIYALKLGQGVGVMGLEHGRVQIERVGELETKDATRNRIKWWQTRSFRYGSAYLGVVDGGSSRWAHEGWPPTTAHWSAVPSCKHVNDGIRWACATHYCVAYDEMSESDQRSTSKWSLWTQP